MASVKADREIERLRAELAAVRASLGDFTYVVTHDLRAPLRHIISYAGLLREEVGGELSGEAARFLGTITEAAQQMGRQIDGLREWAMLDRADLQPVAVDANQLLAELQAAAMAQEQRAWETAAAAQPTGAALSPLRAVQWRVDPALPPLRGDAALLRLLFSHLLGNALKFTRQRKTALIVIEGETGGAGTAGEEWATLHVRDNGAGFDPTLKDKLFNVFQRLHSTQQFEGLGMGLALARKIAQRHGGSIRIDAMPDAGCHVSVTLPMPARQGELL
ncbi:sensor histidine kinase [Hylemonella gracilis]|uniref:histidine kinase n=1 Tax=Hylemonella gracilis ATCC 19624 TaxID=887062 RepID=F3KTJ1_9BURK|nr:ATP-binding protein [Hylemonella gracilis]EGI76870.1 histidine kinase [Hylemonella gracilis ATCC 19624]